MKIITNDIQKIHTAINHAGDIVSSTLGPKGKNVLVGSKFTVPDITNDGLKVLTSLEFEDEAENDVLNLMKAEVKKTNEKLGDSSTTTTTLMQAIFNAGYNREASTDFIKVKTSPYISAIQIMEAKEQVIKKLKPTQIKKLSDLKNVAFISTEDRELGDKIAEVVYKMGKDGVVKVEQSQTIGIETEYVEGMEIHNGYISPYMANTNKGEASIDNPSILVVNSKIEDASPFAELAGSLISQGKRNLVIFTPDIDPAVTIQLLSARFPNNPANTFHYVVVKVNVWDKGIFEDIADITGATLINKDKGMTISGSVDLLGKVSKITVDSKKTVLIGGKKDIDVTTIKAELERTTAPFEKQKIEERIARLTGKIAIIRAGAQTEGKTSHLKDKLDDGINACKRAMEGGVVKGGGLALYEAVSSLDENVLTEALKTPYKLIQNSTGGIDITDDVIDPLISVQTALEVACEFACNMLKLGTIISEKNETDTEQN